MLSLMRFRNLRGTVWNHFITRADLRFLGEMAGMLIVPTVKSRAFSLSEPKILYHINFGGPPLHTHQRTQCQTGCFNGARRFSLAGRWCFHL